MNEKNRQMNEKISTHTQFMQISRWTRSWNSKIYFTKIARLLTAIDIESKYERMWTSGEKKIIESDENENK